MPIFPEKEPIVTEVPERVDIPASLENSTGVKKIETAFTANVKNDNNIPLTSSAASTNVTIQLPADEPTLIAWSKGSITNAITWLAKFWLRFLKIKNASN